VVSVLPPLLWRQKLLGEWLVRSCNLFNCWYSLEVICLTDSKSNNQMFRPCWLSYRGLPLLWDTDQIQVMLHLNKWEMFVGSLSQVLLGGQELKVGNSLLNWHWDFCCEHAPGYFLFAFTKCCLVGWK